MRIKKQVLFILSILLITLITTIIFVGCSKKPASQQTETKKDETVQQEKQQSTQQGNDNAGNSERKMIGNMYTTGLPIVKEKVTLKAIAQMHTLNGNINEMQIVKDIEEKTNIHIDGEYVPPTGWQEKKNLLLASGDLPDLFFAGINPADEVLYGPQGYFVPLQDLIKEWAPNVVALFDKRPEIELEITMPDGNIYSLPRVNELLYRENPDILIINKTWLDNLGLSVPTTTDEYYEVLKAFKNDDPNGNGKKDEIPFSFVFNNRDNGLFSMFGSFGVLDNPNHIMVVDDKVIFSPVQPGYKEALKYFNKLYAEGLIDPESFTQDLPQRRAKSQSQDIIGSLTTFLDENEVGVERAKKDFIALAPLKGPEGHQMWNRYEGEFVMNGGFTITSVNKYPEISMRWVNELFDERTSLEVSRGPFGTNLKENPDGTIEFLPEPEGMSYGEFRFQNAPGDAWPWAMLSDLYAKIGLPEGQARKLNDQYPIYKPYFPEQVYPEVTFTQEQQEKLATLKTDIHGYVDQMVAKWITGEESIDGKWDAYIEQLNKMGLNDLIRIYQEAYDRYYGK